jgi:F-type H+-transporting ATPase subunit delta
MAEISTVARPYAEALFEAAHSQKADLDAWSDQVQAMAQVVSMNDVRTAMSDPRLDDVQRCEIFKGLFKSTALASYMGNLVDVLVSNDRLALLPAIAEQFQELKDQAAGVAQAEITSAFPMTEKQVADLVAVLEPKFKLKLKPRVTVDRALIGGVRVVVGDHVLDTSVQAQLANMRDALVA